MLTIVIATRNRPRHCAALLRLLRSQGVSHRIVIADSSSPAHAERLEGACGAAAEIRHFPPDTEICKKFIAVIETLSTPLVTLMPDDDVTLPHALERCIEHLDNHPDVIAAHGYILDFGIEEEIFDIARVRWFTPTIDQDDPVFRLYHLMSRYQPFPWAVFRVGPLLTALRRASVPKTVWFQEMTLMTTAILLGKVARLPCIYCLRGMEESMTPVQQSDPFFAYLDNSDDFIAQQHAYREALADFIEQQVRPGSYTPKRLRHVLNLIHTISYSRTLDGGILHHTTQLLMGVPLPAIVLPRQWSGSLPIAEGDIVSPSSKQGRRYIWRREMLEAEPREEIVISNEERDRTQRELDDYHLD